MKDIEEPDCMIRYEGDIDEPCAIDELTVQGKIEIERMDEYTFWGRITMDNGTKIELLFANALTGIFIRAEVHE